MSHDPHADPDMPRVHWSTPFAHELNKCDVHYWEAVDRHEDVYRCRYCRATWSLDDGPDGDAA